MSELPTLIADGDPADWLPPIREGRYGRTVGYANRVTVRIDGPLPTVTTAKQRTYGWEGRPLDVGDRVTLATIEVERDEASGGEWPMGPVPFATATVAQIDPWSYMDRDDHGYHITVANVKAL